MFEKNDDDRLALFEMGVRGAYSMATTLLNDADQEDNFLCLTLSDGADNLAELLSRLAIIREAKR
jgi:hypothetical protein